MEIAKRIINLVYALSIMFDGFITLTDYGSMWHNIIAFIKIALFFSLIIAVINFALCKKFTVWNS